MNKEYYIYILSNNSNNVLYIGVTNNLMKRVYEHKSKLVKGFTEKYNVNKLIYFEEYKDIKEAIKREKQLKNWHRGWKLNLIKTMNPNFKDLLMKDAETSSA